MGAIKAAHAAALCQKLLTSQRGRAAAAKVAGPLDETGVGSSLFERWLDSEDFSFGMWLIHQEKHAEGSQFSVDSLNPSASLAGRGRFPWDEGALKNRRQKTGRSYYKL